MSNASVLGLLFGLLLVLGYALRLANLMGNLGPLNKRLQDPPTALPPGSAAAQLAAYIGEHPAPKPKRSHKRAAK